MPINTSSKEACVGSEISHLRKKGYKRDQAIAAAYSICKNVKEKSKKELEIKLLKKVIEKVKHQRAP
jgi:activator of 2-hydroxyglutaryl-CoA dehydratase